MKKDSTWNFDDNYQNLAGTKVAVGSGTNQEKLLLEWKKKLEATGKTFEVKYFQDQNAVNLALSSGKIDIYFGPNPGVQYHISQDASGNSPTAAPAPSPAPGRPCRG